MFGNRKGKIEQEEKKHFQEWKSGSRGYQPIATNKKRPLPPTTGSVIKGRRK